MKIRRFIIAVLFVFTVCVFSSGYAQDDDPSALLPARTYETGIASGVGVYVWKTKQDFLDDDYVQIGISKPGQPVEIPECYLWFIDAKSSEEIVSEVNKKNIPGLFIYDIQNKADLKHLEGLKQLKSLRTVYCREISNAGLEHISNLRQLHALKLYDCDKITADGLRYIANFKQLRYLILRLYFHQTDSVYHSPSVQTSRHL